jgi:hypothetical protein
MQQGVRPLFASDDLLECKEKWKVTDVEWCHLVPELWSCQVAEGVPTTAAVHSQAADLGLSADLPIVEEVYSLLYEGRTTAQALKNLMTIPVGNELAALRGE